LNEAAKFCCLPHGALHSRGVADRTILIDPVSPEMRDDEGDLIFPADTVLVICPHCELESLYQSDEIRCEQEQQRHCF
jgi:hypothetical protein